MKLAAALAIAVTLALPASSGGAAGQRVLGIDWTVLGMRLGWYEPATLTLLPGRTVPLVSHDGPWSLSPNGTRLAIAGRAGDVRIVDVRRMRTLGAVALKLKAPPSSVTWLRTNRLLVTGGASVAVVDPQRLRLVRRASIPGVVNGRAAFSGGVAVLLAPSTEVFAAAKVAVLDADGRVRTSTLDRVSIGFRRTGDTLDVRTAGFAVDPTTQHAFVVAPDDTIAAVDLRTLAVAYHDGTSRYAAKPFPGPQRTARWLGNGLLAVAGNNGFIPSGLKIVDTRDWTVRVVDQSSESVTVAGVVAIGSSGPNYAAYAPDGTQRYRLALATGEDLQVAGRYGYVCASSKLRSVLDLSTGTPVTPAHGSVCVTVLKR